MKLVKNWNATTALLALALLGGCAQTVRTSTPERTSAPERTVLNAERLESLGGAFVAPGPVSASQSRVVVYRRAESRLPGATSVFVDERYHASLVSGAWSAFCYRAAPVELGARQMQVGSRHKDLMDTITALNLEPGQTHYLRVQDGNARPVLQPVQAAQALQELVGTREQKHTISRVAQDCVAAPAVAAPALVRERITLASDTLFAFDRSDAQGMTGAGLQEIDRLMARINESFTRVEQVHVIGHADPLGQAARNEKLSAERAQTVREHLLRKGRTSVDITTEGRGSREPVVTACPRVASPASIACNLPNRRVEVVVTGQRR
jgi:outer membrane protein OmpA-like peptidoglycan-associated protein